MNELREELAKAKGRIRDDVLDLARSRASMVRAHDAVQEIISIYERAA